MYEDIKHCKTIQEMIDEFRVVVDHLEFLLEGHGAHFLNKNEHDYLISLKHIIKIAERNYTNENQKKVY